jgi:threonine/homoserine/homoserine lactone efflux protein
MVEVVRRVRIEVAEWVRRKSMWTEIGRIVAAVFLTLVLGGCLYLCYVVIKINDEERRAGKQ